MGNEPEKPSYTVAICFAAWFAFWIFDPFKLEWLALKPGFMAGIIYGWIWVMLTTVRLKRQFWNISVSEYRKKEMLLAESKRLAKEIFKQSVK